MRAAAESAMRELGYWGKGRMPLAVYTAARYVASEVGSGTPEEKVAVIEAAVNRAELERLRDINSLLLYRQGPGHPNYGYYGPIHKGGDVSTHPYGRWAATSKDPGIDDLLIADFVLAGRTKNFSRGADDQLGMDAILRKKGAAAVTYAVKANAAKQDYWVGPLPGVDHWHTFLFAHRPDIDPSSTTGQALIQRALDATTTMIRPDWSTIAMCSSGPKMPVPVFAGLALAAGLGLAYAMAVYVEPTWRDRPWMSRGL
jgi:hypothetical protein